MLVTGSPLSILALMDLRVAIRAGIVAALVIGALVCHVPAHAAAATPSRAFFGMQTWTMPNPEEIAMMRRGGVGSVRVIFPGALLSSPDEARWAPYDELMAAAARERVEILPTLFGISGSRLRVNRPRTRAQRMAWAGFVSAVASRYGRGGTFWESRPELEPIPLRAYQVWNEPNLPVYWSPAGNVASYLSLVRLTRARLRRVDPKASIVLAGLPDSRLGTPMLEYLRAIYAQRGARTLFDVVALHPYAADASGVLRKLNGVRAYMNRRGDRRTPIWVTEVGWATGGLRSPYRTTKAGQAARVGQTLRALRDARWRLRLGRVFLFGLQDRPYGAEESRWWGPRVGLFDLNGRPKPAWRTFTGVTGGRPGGRLRSLAG